MLYIGCPMWGYKGWSQAGKSNEALEAYPDAGYRVDFFPPRTASSEFLRLYSQRLTCVEGNTMFYATPSAETVAHWAQETPETFRFCPKVSRNVSHAARLETTRAETLAFVERMRGLGTRLGPLFLQLPPTFAPAYLEQLHMFLEFWPKDVHLAVEVRHSAFFAEPVASELNALLSNYGVGRVIMDTRPLRVGSTKEQQLLQARERKPHLPVPMVVTTDFAFVRYIGHPRRAVNAPLLTEWAQQAEQWLTQGRTLYLFCHCPYEDYSPAICADLYQRIRELLPLPPLPWPPGSSDTQPIQERLF